MDAIMEIQHLDGGSSTPDAGLKDAISSYARRKWPTHTIKNIERCWDLTTDEAKGLLRGQSSLRTIEKVLSHKNGGWHVALPLLGGVIGHGIADFIASERNRLDHEAEQRRQRAAELMEAEGLFNAVGVDALRPAYAGMGSR